MTFPTPILHSGPPAVPRKAASLIVLRDTADGPQVLLLRRADKPGDQNSGAAVFPGAHRGAHRSAPLDGIWVPIWVLIWVNTSDAM